MGLKQKGKFHSVLSLLLMGVIATTSFLTHGITIHAANTKTFYTVNVSDSTFHDKGYKDSSGNIAYCANQNLPGPGSDGMSYTEVSSKKSYDYLMYHGYPNTKEINGKTWSNNDARDITQYAAWLIELGIPITVIPKARRGTMRQINCSKGQRLMRAADRKTGRLPYGNHQIAPTSSSSSLIPAAK